MDSKSAVLLPGGLTGPPDEVRAANTTGGSNPPLSASNLLTFPALQRFKLTRLHYPPLENRAQPPQCYYVGAKTATTAIASGIVFSYSSLRNGAADRMEFRVIWEIEIEADSPRQAVEEARAMQLRLDMPATVFGAWDHTRQKMYRIDLAASAEMLNEAELASLRAAFRQLQCAPHLLPTMKNLISVMLIFLDAENGYSKRH